MVSDAFLFNNQYDKVRIKGKWNNSKKGIIQTPTPQRSTYWKGNHWVAFEYGRATYHLSILKYVPLVSSYLSID